MARLTRVDFCRTSLHKRKATPWHHRSLLRPLCMGRQCTAGQANCECLFVPSGEAPPPARVGDPHHRGPSLGKPPVRPSTLYRHLGGVCAPKPQQHVDRSLSEQINSDASTPSPVSSPYSWKTGKVHARVRLEHPVDSGHRVQGSRRMKWSRSPRHQHQRCCIRGGDAKVKKESSSAEFV
jgi:hypothetical protein